MAVLTSEYDYYDVAFCLLNAYQACLIYAQRDAFFCRGTHRYAFSTYKNRYNTLILSDITSKHHHLFFYTHTHTHTHAHTHTHTHTRAHTHRHIWYNTVSTHKEVGCSQCTEYMSGWQCYDCGGDECGIRP
jgi:hypothetical protein